MRLKARLKVLDIVHLAPPGLRFSEDDDFENLPLREILSLLLGPEGRRMLSLRTKSNDELFRLWRAELAFRYRSDRSLKEAERVMGVVNQRNGTLL